MKLAYLLLCSGNAKYEPGAVVCRVSPSFVRFGTFQLPAIRGGDQIAMVPPLADYVIRHHYSHLQGTFPEPFARSVTTIVPCKDLFKEGIAAKSRVVVLGEMCACTDGFLYMHLQLLCL